jgi:hypothetical protein
MGQVLEITESQAKSSRLGPRSTSMFTLIKSANTMTERRITANRSERWTSASLNTVFPTETGGISAGLSLLNMTSLLEGSSRSIRNRSRMLPRLRSPFDCKVSYTAGSSGVARQDSSVLASEANKAYSLWTHPRRTRIHHSEGAIDRDLRLDRFTVATSDNGTRFDLESGNDNQAGRYSNIRWILRVKHILLAQLG